MKWLPASRSPLEIEPASRPQYSPGVVAEDVNPPRPLEPSKWVAPLLWILIPLCAVSLAAWPFLALGSLVSAALAVGLWCGVAADCGAGGTRVVAGSSSILIRAAGAPQRHPLPQSVLHPT